MKQSSLRHSLPFVLACSAIALSACGGGQPITSSLSSSGAGSSSGSVASSSASSSSSSSSSSSKTSSSSSSSSGPSHTQTELDEYLAGLKTSSVSNHLYYHYLRFNNVASDYSAWDVWAWPLSKEGYRFDWAGRTTSNDRMSASGLAKIDSFGGAYVDIDLTQNTYDGGWKNSTKTMGGSPMSFLNADGSLVSTVGLQIVKSQTRVTSSSFWTNDGDNLFVKLSDYAFQNSDGTTSYHVFVSQDQVKYPSASPKINIVDPFANDDGKNVTYGNSAYSNASTTDKPLAATSPLFLKGDENKSYLSSGAGVGYQIMVSSFADSDNDGFGDIYGIDQKLDYLKALGGQCPLAYPDPALRFLPWLRHQ